MLNLTFNGGWAVILMLLVSYADREDWQDTSPSFISGEGRIAVAGGAGQQETFSCVIG